MDYFTVIFGFWDDRFSQSEAQLSWLTGRRLIVASVGAQSSPHFQFGPCCFRNKRVKSQRQRPVVTQSVVFLHLVPCDDNAAFRVNSDDPIYLSCPDSWQGHEHHKQHFIRIYKQQNLCIKILAHLRLGQGHINPNWKKKNSFTQTFFKNKKVCDRNLATNYSGSLASVQEFSFL